MRCVHKMLLFLLLAGIAGIPPHAAKAQAPGSVTTFGGPLSTVSIAGGGTQADVAETVYIGPGNYQVDGTWEIYAKNVVVDPAAVVTGNGSIVFYNASAAGGVSGITLIDGNNSTNVIDANMVLQNAAGMQIANVDFPPDLTGSGFTNNSMNSVYAGKDLDLAVDGADVILGTGTIGDLHFDNDATLSNYSVNRMVITNNSIVSHVVKDAFSTGTFVFPVGIADGDYTPASITGSGPYSVSVQDYAGHPGTPQINVTQEGMNRTWHVYGGTAASVMLTHNTATNGSSYTDNLAYITRYLGGAAWSSGTPEYASPGVHTSAVIGSGIPALGTSDAAWLSKASDATPLPVTLAHFEGKVQQCTSTLTWRTATEHNFNRFEVEYSNDAVLFRKVGEVAGSGSANGGTYTFSYVQPSEKGYYRLKIVDLGDKAEYSKTITLVADCNNPWGIAIYPNPTSDRITVAGLKEKEWIQVYDASGRLLIRRQANAATVTVDLSLFAPGEYAVILLNGTERLLTTKVTRR